MSVCITLRRLVLLEKRPIAVVGDVYKERGNKVYCIARSVQEHREIALFLLTRPAPRTFAPEKRGNFGKWIK